MFHDKIYFLLLFASPFIGSFIGMLSYRLPRHIPFIVGRSCCDRCNRTLSIRDLIPILSYALLQGKCRTCKNKIPLLYPLLEVWAVIVVLWAASETTHYIFIATCCIGWLLTLIAAIDFQHTLIPPRLSITLALAALGFWALESPEFLKDAIIGGIIGISFLEVCRIVFLYLRKKHGLGGGDPLLFGAIGLWVGWQGLATVMLIATFAALSYVVLYRGAAHKISERIPFAPFLAIGCWVTWLYGPLGA